MYIYTHTNMCVCVCVCMCVVCVCVYQDIRLSSGMHSAAIPEALTFEPTEEQALNLLALLVQK